MIASVIDQTSIVPQRRYQPSTGVSRPQAKFAGELGEGKLLFSTGADGVRLAFSSKSILEKENWLQTGADGGRLAFSSKPVREKENSVFKPGLV